MNHPKREEWVPYLYGEAEPLARQRLKAHLRDCAECQQEIEGWRRSLKRLDAWRLPAAHKAGERFAPALRWALAGALAVLGVGFGLGRFTSPRADVERVRAAIEPGLKQELRRELARMLREQTDHAATATLAATGEQTKALLADYAQAVETSGAEERQLFRAALDKLETEHLADFVAIKKDLDIVALNTDAGFRDTAQELVELADYNQPMPGSNPSQKQSQ